MSRPARAGSARVMSRPSMRIDPVSGHSSPATRRSVVVLPAPVGPSSTTNSPFATVRSRLSTASVVPKRLLTLESAISAIRASLLMGGCARARSRNTCILSQCSPDCPAACLIEERKALTAKREADRLARGDGGARGKPRLQLTVLGGHRHDLGGAEIFRAEDRSAELRCIVEADVLGADAECELGLREVLADFRDGDRRRR